jgi:hypothetical protein
MSRTWIVFAHCHRQRRNGRSPKDEIPLRTVFNIQTRQHEQVPVSQFQQMLSRGQIQLTFTERPDGHREHTYRLV